MNTTSTKNVSRLNGFLRGELGALETYRLALDKLELDDDTRIPIERCFASHQYRAEKLRRKVLELGGEPPDGPGAYGAFLKLCAEGARLFGDKRAIGLLEQVEDHELADYRAELNKLDFDLRYLITSEILPEQEQTHRTMSTLKHQLQ